MSSSDPASLQNLNDIVMPAPVGWLPLAAGWYLVVVLLSLVLFWFGYRFLQTWLSNRYRRAALTELLQLEKNIHIPTKRDTSLRQLPVLLKRTALSAYSRQEVASLSGVSWHEFLNSSTDSPVFSESDFATLNKISYATGGLGEIGSEALTNLLEACEKWLRHHEPQCAHHGIKRAD